MQLNKHDKKYKYFLKLRRERDKLYNETWAMPYIDVTPFQSGWRCTVQIKPQYLTIKGLKESIELGYDYEHIRHVRDVKNIRKGLTRIMIGKIERNYFPNRKRISVQHFDTLEPNIKKWFTLESREQIGNVTRRLKNQRLYYSINVSKNWLKLHVKPDIYTKIKQINPQIESRLQELREIFEQECYWEIYESCRGWRNYNMNIRQDFKRQLHKFKLGQIDNIENNKYKLGWN